MILVYFLPIVTIDGTEQVAGIEFIRDALLESTEDLNDRKLIQDTTQAEHDGLFMVATYVRDPTQAELERYHADVIPSIPDPDVERIMEILENSPPPIPAPEIWELFRLLAKRSGIVT